MNLSRIAPLLLIGGIAYAKQDEVKDYVAIPIDMVKIAVTQVELASMKRMIVADVISGSKPSDIKRKFKSYIQQNFTSTSRDPSVDYWGKDYRMGSASRNWKVWSCGPDMSTGSSDDVTVTIQTSLME